MAPRPKKTVADFPEVALQWHPTRNLDIRPEDVGAGSTRVCWWICPEGPDHVWHGSPNARIKVRRKDGGTVVTIRGCPACAGKQVSVTNCLATLYPRLAKQWHPTKNSDLTPRDVVGQSNTPLWWKCPKGPDHEWRASPNRRISLGTGCPCCAGRQVSVTNSLASLRPDLAKQWHPRKNGTLTPDQVLAGTSKKHWWKCPNGPDHEWAQSPSQRISKGADCPFCRGLKVSVTNSLASRFPHVAKLWHPTKNGHLSPYDVTFGSGQEIWWKCSSGPDHEWKRSANRMTDSRASACPFCSNLMLSVTNSLARKFPKIADEFHRCLNVDEGRDVALTAHDVIAGSGLEVWWQCSKNDEHEWRAPIVRRTANRSGCPWCRIVPRSKVEILIGFELAYVLGFDPTKHKVRIGNYPLDVDVLIPQMSTIIEYDGCYSHHGKEEADHRKTQRLQDAGWTVIRLREEPLERLDELDVVIPVTRVRDLRTIKEVVDMTLRQIGKVRGVKNLIANVAAYLRRKSLANSGAAELHIEKLLSVAR